MMDDSDMREADGNEVDPKLRHLVARFLDHSLSKEESAALERRLRTDPSALAYCSDLVNFDASLQAVLGEQELEWEDTRRIRFNPRGPGPTWSVERQQEFHVGHQRRRPRIIIGAVVAAVLAAVSIFLFGTHNRSTFHLRNGGFEAMDLSQSPTPESMSILYWQETFSTGNATVLDLNRATDGEIYAKSGRNVVALQPRAFLNQMIIDSRGKNLPAIPAAHVTVTGWYYCTDAQEARLEASLRFVASGYPAAVQYNVAVQDLELLQGGWHRFEFDMTVPNDLWRKPDIVSEGVARTPGAIDLEGKPLTLSLDFYNTDGQLLLDDLSLEADLPH